MTEAKRREAKLSCTSAEYLNRIRESVLLEAGEQTTEKTEDKVEFRWKEQMSGRKSESETIFKLWIGET